MQGEFQRKRRCPGVKKLFLVGMLILMVSSISFSAKSSYAIGRMGGRSAVPGIPIPPCER